MLKRKLKPTVSSYYLQFTMQDKNEWKKRKEKERERIYNEKKKPNFHEPRQHILHVNLNADSECMHLSHHKRAEHAIEVFSSSFFHYCDDNHNTQTFVAILQAHNQAVANNESHF